MSSSTGNPPPDDKAREPKPHKRGLFRGKKGHQAPQEENKESAKRFQEFFEKA